MITSANPLDPDTLRRLATEEPSGSPVSPGIRSSGRARAWRITGWIVLVGLLLIVVFSLGLAATLTGLGVAVVYAQKLTTRINFSSRLATALPAISALVIVGAGLVLTVQAVPKVV